jgi:hypothetical protein
MPYRACVSKLDTIESHENGHEVIEKLGSTNNTYYHIVTKNNGDKMS